MRKIVWAIALIIIVTPILVNLEWIIGGYPWVLSNMESDVRNHLTSKGYKPGDIQNLKITYNRKLGTYTAQVIFRDDANNIYYYDYIHNKINQTGITTSDRKNAKHLEK